MKSFLKFRAEGFLALAAISLCLYHTLFSLGWQHFSLPKATVYMDYALVLLFAAAFLLAVLSQYRQHSSLGGLISSFSGNILNRYTLGLVLLFGVFCISAILTNFTNPGSLVANRGCLYEAGISFFVIFPLGHWFALREDKRLLHGMIDLLTAAFTVFLALSFLSLFGENDFISISGVSIWDGRLYLKTHPNVTGMVCCMLIMSGMYRFLVGGKWVKVLYGLAIILLFTALILTDSRASLVAFIAGVGSFTVLCVLKRIKGKHSLKNVLFICIAAVFAVLLFLLMRNFNRLADAGFRTRGFLNDPLGAGSGRLELWWTILHDILPNHRDILLHGCSPYEIVDTLASLAGTVDKIGYAINTHNQFLEVAMAYGVPAMAAFLLWLLMLAKCSWKIGTASFQTTSLAERLLPLLLLVLIVNNMFETKLLFYRYVAGCVFFFIAGHVCGTYQRQQTLAKK